MGKKGIRIVVFLCLFTFFFLAGNDYTWGQDLTAQQGRVVCIVIDKLSMNDLLEEDFSHLRTLAEEGCLGLMNTRTNGKGDSPDGCLTIGAGAPVMCGPRGVEAYNADERPRGLKNEAGFIYQRVTGYNPQQAKVLVVNLPEAVQANLDNNNPVLLGRLGEELVSHGLVTCAVGNGDVWGEAKRSAAAIAMDARGRVGMGDVSQKMNRPGVITDCESDYERMLPTVLEFLTQADFLVVELSDLARLEDPKVTLFAQALQNEHYRLLSEIDWFVGEIADNLDPQKDLLIIVAPSASRMEKEVKNTFTPLIIWGKGFQNGLLTSSGTKRRAMVANVDLAPTVLDFFQINYDQTLFRGRPAQRIAYEQNPSPSKIQEVYELNQLVKKVNILRYPLIKGYVVFQIAVLFLGLMALLVTFRFKRAISFLVFLIPVWPLVFLLASAWIKLPVIPYSLLTVLVALVIALALRHVLAKRGYLAFVLVGLITMLLLDVDTFLGNPWLKYSVLGYDPMAGSRYYGIGNEYMGILIGCTILVGAALFQYLPRRWASLLAAGLFTFQFYIIGAPGLGTNAGGAISGAFGFLVTYLLLKGIKLDLKKIGIILLLSLAVLGFITFLDMHRSPELQTHIGKAANLIAANGWNEAWQIIYRKLAMNLRLIRYTIWSRVFLAALITLAFLLLYPKGIMAKLAKEHTSLVNGCTGGVLAAFAALVFNDSGIVAAATTSIFVAFPLLYLSLEINEKEREVEVYGVRGT